MELARELAALALVFGLLGASLWLLRSRGRLRWRPTAGGRKQARRLESLDRLALSPQHALHMVRAADRVLMLVTHAGGCTLLAQLPSPEAGRGVHLAGSTAFEKALS
jgi:flagellar biogenesis protein FliO